MISETGLARAAWRKSSRSGGGNNCVEVAGIGGVCAIRDSKNPTGPKLILARSEWKALVESVKNNERDAT
ncbi:MAG: DUF397 domain-containing protein [Streptomycetales bacterium]